MEFIWITQLQRTVVTVGQRRHSTLASGCPAAGVSEGDLTLPRYEHLGAAETTTTTISVKVGFE